MPSFVGEKFKGLGDSSIKYFLSKCHRKFHSASQSSVRSNKIFFGIDESESYMFSHAKIKLQQISNKTNVMRSDLKELETQ